MFKGAGKRENGHCEEVNTSNMTLQVKGNNGEEGKLCVEGEG